MTKVNSTFPRELTVEERSLTRWILQNGHCQEAFFFEQLDRAKVYGCCTCGCASVDFQIDGVEPSRETGMEILGDFVYRENDILCGVFVFAYGGNLAGLEVYPLSEDEAPRTLPRPSALRPIETEIKEVEEHHSS